MYHAFRNLCIAALTSASLTSVGLYADDAPVSFSLATDEFSENFILDEIVVTAQRKSDNLQDVPVSLSVYSANALENSNITNFSDLNRLSAGLSVIDIADGFGNTVRMRGVGQEAFGLTLQPSVAILIDGIAQPRLETAFASFLDIERIEVLRGPQGTLWGRNAPSGAITIKSHDADTSELTASLETIAGTLGTDRQVAIVNAPLIENVLGLRITGFQDEQERAIKYVNFDHQPASSDRKGGRIKLRYTPTDSLDIALSYERNDIDAITARERVKYGDNFSLRAGLAARSLDQPDPFDQRTTSDHLSVFTSSTENSNLRAQLNLNTETTLTWLSGYQEFRNELRGEVETSPLDLFNVDYSRNIDNNFSHELQLTFEGDTVEYLAGAYYSEVRQRGPTALSAGVDGLAINNAAINGFTNYGAGGGAIDFAIALGALNAGTPTPAANEARGLLSSVLVPNITLQNAYSTTIQALFGHITKDLADRITLDAGIRYSSEKVRSTNTAMTTFNNLPALPIPPSFAETSISGGEAVAFHDGKNFSATTGDVKLSFAINPDITLYSGVAYGYKAGGFNGAASPSVSNDPATREFDEETTLNYEFGWKAELAGRRLRSNGTIFYQTYDDYQVQFPEATTGTNIISNADVISQGVETDLTFRATQSLTVAGTIAYVDAYYDDYKNAPCTSTQDAQNRATLGNFAPCAQDLSDHSLNLNSRWTANINAEYRGEELNIGNWSAHWFGFFETVFRDEFVGDPSGNTDTKTSAYSIFNTKLGLSGDNWEAELWAKNILDKEYFVSLQESAFSDGSVGVQGPRRSVGARLKLSLN